MVLLIVIFFRITLELDRERAEGIRGQTAISMWYSAGTGEEYKYWYLSTSMAEYMLLVTLSCREEVVSRNLFSSSTEHIVVTIPRHSIKGWQYLITQEFNNNNNNFTVHLLWYRFVLEYWLYHPRLIF
jgi:hypothetical protein